LLASTRVTLRATVIFTLTASIEVVLHELAHATAAIAIGGRPVVLYPGAVTPGNVTPSQYAVIAAAGPLFSLVMFGIGLAACRRLRARNETRLAAVWFTFHSFIGSVGYLILTPFGTNDLGGIAHVFHLAPLVRWGMFGAGIWAMTKIDGVLAPTLAELAPADVTTPTARASYVTRTAIVPWLVFGAMRLAIDLPLQSIFVLGPTIGMGIPILGTYSAARKRGDLPAGAGTWREGVPWLLLIADVALLVVNRFVLHAGLTLAR
jgi:hypothetical protein